MTRVSVLFFFDRVRDGVKERSKQMSVYHLCTNVGPWACADLAALDTALARAGSVPLDVPWDTFALEEDGDHFTAEGAETFAHALVMTLGEATPRNTLVIADSTMGHRPIPGLPVSWEVDAVCGSGFVAMAWDDRHFRARLRHEALSPLHWDAVVFVGGWNDVRQTTHSISRVCAAAEACVARAARLITA